MSLIRVDNKVRAPLVHRIEKVYLNPMERAILFDCGEKNSMRSKLMLFSYEIYTTSSDNYYLSAI
jgi:hypothetical protein